MRNARKNVNSYNSKSPIDGWEGLLMKTGVGGIPARSGSTAGSADATMCAIKNDGSIVEMAASFKVFNPFGTAIAGSTYITVKVINGTQLVIDSEDCPAA